MANSSISTQPGGSKLIFDNAELSALIISEGCSHHNTEFHQDHNRCPLVL